MVGHGDRDQREHRRWKRWSGAHLNVQKAKGVPEEALGSLLFTLLDGATLRAFGSVPMDRIEAVGGQQVVYEILDDRFPEGASHDRIGTMSLTSRCVGQEGGGVGGISPVVQRSRCGGSTQDDIS